MTVDEHYLQITIAEFQRLKKLSEDAIAQVPDDELGVRLDAESNSIAIVMQHMAGNLRSRFTEFLTTDGEKPNRNRDAEFEMVGAVDRAAMQAHWERGWETLFESLAALAPSDLLRDVYIRGERHTVLQALNRALTHQAYHVGQIVFLAKHFRSVEWRSLSIQRKR